MLFSGQDARAREFVFTNALETGKLEAPPACGLDLSVNDGPSVAYDVVAASFDAVHRVLPAMGRADH